jgi:tape measure domain-containing protein
MDDTEFRKGMNRLKAQAETISTIGDRLTVGLTLPIAALANFSKNAFAEFDSLRRGLDAVTGSTEATAERLKELREIAKQPGIGFQEAIKGDIRLRAVGISAGQSAKILKEFANAIALTGGGAAELNSVTVQLGQLSAKGKVLAQDLKPIIEAAPAVGKALKEMYGTVDSESIQGILAAQGKNSNQFIDELVKKLADVPRVTGGFKNALENLKDSTFVFGSAIGDVANDVFGLDVRLQAFADKVSDTADQFRGLSTTQQRLILSTTGFAAAIGPVLSILGRLPGALINVVKGKDLLVKGFGSLSSVLGGASFGGGFMGFVNAALSRVPQLAVATTALTLVYKNLGNILGSFKDFAQYFTDLYNESIIIKVAVDSISAAFAGVGLAIGAALKVAGGFIEGLFRNLKTILGIFGDTFKAILTGNISEIPSIFSNALNKSNKTWYDWFDSIGKYGEGVFYKLVNIVSGIGENRPTAGTTNRGSAFNLAQFRKNKPEEDLASSVGGTAVAKVPDALTEALKKMNEQLTDASNRSKFFGSSFNLASEQLDVYANALNDIAAISGPKALAQATAIQEKMINLRGPNTLTDPLATFSAGMDAVIQKATNLSKISAFENMRIEIGNIQSPIAGLQNEFADIERIGEGLGGSFDVVAEKIQALNRAFQNGEISVGTYKNAMGQLNTMAYKTQEAVRSIAAGFANFNVSIASTNEVRAAVAGLTAEIETQRAILIDSSSTDAQKTAAAAQIALINQQIKAEKDKGNIVRQVSLSIVRSIKDSIQAYIAQAIAGLIAKEASTKGIIGLALAGIGAGVVFSLFDTLVPKLAKGGLAFGPTLAMVGDNKNAKNDPELITPLSKLKNYLDDTGGGRGSEIYGRLAGYDLLLSNQYTASYYSRLN